MSHGRTLAVVALITLPSLATAQRSDADFWIATTMGEGIGDQAHW